jgi:hypothetical protein
MLLSIYKWRTGQFDSFYPFPREREYVTYRSITKA